jgi:uncharacterized protein (DUF433 family)
MRSLFVSSFSPVMDDPIEVSPDKLGGTPVFRGTRIPISYLAEYLNDGYTVGDFIDVYDIDPDLVHQVYEERFKDDAESGETTPA